MSQPARSTSAAVLGLPSLIALIIANMVGAGVFTTSGFALGDLGSANRVMAAWVVGGVIALCGALSYGGLVRHITESGGEYLFLSRIIHPVAGFIAGWVSLLAGFTGAIAFAARAFETYAFPTRPDWLPSGLAASLMVLVAAALHGVKVQTGAVSQNIVVAVKVAMLLGFLLFSASVAMTRGMGPAPAPVAPFDFVIFAGSLVWISLSYSGFNAAVYVVRVISPPRSRVFWLKRAGDSPPLIVGTRDATRSGKPESVTGCAFCMIDPRTDCPARTDGADSANLRRSMSMLACPICSADWPCSAFWVAFWLMP
jgi:APA family basic amino acid/polyamine antiporter